MIEAQRLRNLTTDILHTEMGHVYQDIELITGMKGLMTHMLPNVLRAIKPWLREKVTDPRYWNDEFDQDHSGEEFIHPMSDVERSEMLLRYKALPHPFEKLGADTL